MQSSDQILMLVSSWDAALADAGLAPRQGLGGTAPRSYARPIIDVLDCCYEHFEVLPSWYKLQGFAAANGISMRKKTTGKPWTLYVEEWKVARRARGLPEPNGPTARGQDPTSPKT